VAAELNRRYQDVLKKPVRSGTVSVVLRRLLATRRIQQVRPGKALHEALYSRISAKYARLGRTAVCFPCHA
jgi:hypothetical protein